jgi:hypothetical protein
LYQRFILVGLTILPISLRNLPPTKPETRDVTTPTSFGKTEETMAYKTIPPIAPKMLPHTGHIGSGSGGGGGQGHGNLHLLGYGVPHHPAINARIAKVIVIFNLH